jgi:hypothetical protein
MVCVAYVIKLHALFSFFFLNRNRAYHYNKACFLFISGSGLRNANMASDMFYCIISWSTFEDTCC